MDVAGIEPGPAAWEGRTMSIGPLPHRLVMRKMNSFFKIPPIGFVWSVDELTTAVLRRCGFERLRRRRRLLKEITKMDILP